VGIGKMELLEYNGKKFFIYPQYVGNNFIFRLYLVPDKKEYPNLCNELLKIEIMEAIKFGYNCDFVAEEIVNQNDFSFEAEFLANLQQKLFDSYFKNK
jgi:hypothetical protein